MTLTLNLIRAQSPCPEGWTNLLAHLGKTKADDEPLDLLTVLDSNGLDDALWVLDRTNCNPRLARHFGAWCAEQVLPIFERERPDDMRPRQAIAVARDDNATEQDRAAAQDAAWVAARAAAWAAAWVAARDAAGAAARAAARAAVGDAVGDAAGAAEWDAARAAVGDAQETQLRKMLEELSK